MDRILRALASRPWVMPLAIALTLAAAIAYLATAQNVYKAEADVLVTPVPSDTAVPGLGLILDSSDPARATETIARLVKTPAVAQRVKTELKLGGSLRDILRDVEAKPVAQSNLVAITAKGDDPAAAARLGDGFANALIETRTARLHGSVDAAIQDIDRRIAGLTPAENSQREGLLARGSDLRTLRGEPDPSLQVASTADLPDQPVSPRPLLSIAGALLAGAILGLLGVLALEYVDPRLLREEQLKAAYRLPVLARIARERRHTAGPLRPDMISARAADGYRMLRANLPSEVRPGSGQRRQAPRGLLDSGGEHANGVPAAGFSALSAGARGIVMVTSPRTGDGKTTTALNLAAALAGGWERVMLIEADVEHPSLGKALGRPGAHGLGSVLSEHVHLAEALIPVRLPSGTVHVLPADASGGRDALSDPALPLLIEEASAAADWVVVDLPPLNEAPEVLSVVRKASDLLVTVRLKHSNLRELSALAELLVRQEVTPAGFVLLGTRRRSDTEDRPRGKSQTAEPAEASANGSVTGRETPGAPVVRR